MNALGDIARDHLAWLAAGIGLPFAVALWIVIGGHLIESRHGDQLPPPDPERDRSSTA